MGKKADLVRIIAEHGCDGVPCSDCPFTRDGGNCDVYDNQASYDLDSPEIKAQAQAWLDKRAEKKARKQAEKEPAQPAWDGEFVPGEFYLLNDGMVILADSIVTEAGKITIINASVIRPSVGFIGGQYAEIYSTMVIRPVRVKITVED